MNRQRLLTIAGFVGVLVIGIVIGSMSGRAGGSSNANPATPAATPDQATATWWTCSMHPQVRLPRPGRCPICSMPLVPADTAKATDGKGLAIDPAARALIGVRMVQVERRALTHDVRAVGSVMYAESGLADATARIDGYVERVIADRTGIEVHRGDPLVEIYSPQLAVAQQELLLSKNAGEASVVAEAARQRLLRWGIDDQQIAEVIKTGKPLDRVTLRSPADGVIVEKMAVTQAMVRAGEPMYRIASADPVWLVLSVYEFELPWVKVGQHAEVSTVSLPGQTFGGEVSFVSPAIDEQTRTASVRVVVSNADRRLKPGMYGSAVIHTSVGADTAAHSEHEHAGHEPAPATAGGDVDQTLAIPASAILDTGTRTIVYVLRDDGTFAAVPVSIGPRAGDWVPVLAGLSEGQHVVAEGNLLIDSQFQIQGLPSLFNADGAAAPAPKHQH